MSYSKNAEGVEIYPFDKATGDMVYLINDEGIQIPAAKTNNGSDDYYYATKTITLSDGTKNIIEYPPVDTSKNDNKPLYITETQIIMKNGKEERFKKQKYPMNVTTGNPIYEKTESSGGDEKYFIDTFSGNEFYGVNLHTANEVYAKDHTGKEIFPNTNAYAVNNITKEQLYPRYNDGCEYYKLENLKEIAARDAQNNVKYAKLISGEEIYPLDFTKKDE